MITSSTLDSGGKMVPVDLTGSFLEDQDKVPAWALKLTVEEAEKVFDEEKTLFVFDADSVPEDSLFFVSSDDSLLGVVELGSSFEITSSEFKLMKSKHQMTEAPSDNLVACRVSQVSKLTSPTTIMVSDDVPIHGIEAQVVSKARVVSIWKEAATEERIIAAAVLVPGKTDLDGEIYTAEVVRQAAYFFLEHYWEDDKHGIDVQHDLEIIPDAIRPVMSYVLDEEKTFVVDVPALEEDHPARERTEVTYPAGTWLLYSRVISDKLWDQVKSGELKSWSIYGIALAVDLEDAA